jgi:hypothetical protein
MGKIDDHGHIEVDHEGKAVCSAEVDTDDDARSVRVSLHAESGHLPTGARERLVDEVLQLPQVRSSDHVAMSVPRGDAESLARLHQRCDDLSVRPAGSTVIVELDARRRRNHSADDAGPARHDTSGPEPA